MVFTCTGADIALPLKVYAVSAYSYMLATICAKHKDDVEDPEEIFKDSVLVVCSQC
jgi:hypothetical protein